MKKILCLFVVILSFTMSGQGFSKNIGCVSRGYVSICNFDGIENQPNQTVYFYCRSPKILPFIKFTNHHVLISGFVSGRDVGAGTLTLSGIDAAKMLSTYFFAVKDDPGYHDDKYVYIVATSEIRCDMGTGGRPLQFPGLLG